MFVFKRNKSHGGQTCIYAVLLGDFKKEAQREPPTDSHPLQLKFFGRLPATPNTTRAPVGTHHTQDKK